jgi:hypothetical protein
MPFSQGLGLVVAGQANPHDAGEGGQSPDEGVSGERVMCFAEREAHPHPAFGHPLPQAVEGPNIYKPASKEKLIA